MKNLYWFFGVAIISVIATTLFIYLTPLKNLNMVEPKTKDVDPAEFWKDYSDHPEKYLFIDVRDVDDYAENHPKGAINMPIHELFDKHNDLPRSGKTIVLTCSGGSLAGVAYGYLEHQGFLNLRRIHGGLRNWIIEGMPIESGNGATTTPETAS